MRWHPVEESVAYASPFWNLVVALLLLHARAGRVVGIPLSLSALRRVLISAGVGLVLRLVGSRPGRGACVASVSRSLTVALLVFALFRGASSVVTHGDRSARVKAAGLKQKCGCIAQNEEVMIRSVPDGRLSRFVMKSRGAPVLDISIQYSQLCANTRKVELRSKGSGSHSSSCRALQSALQGGCPASRGS